MKGEEGGQGPCSREWSPVGRMGGQAGPHSPHPCLWGSRVTTGYASSGGGTALQAAGRLFCDRLQRQDQREA